MSSIQLELKNLVKCFSLRIGEDHRIYCILLMAWLCWWLGMSYRVSSNYLPFFQRNDRLPLVSTPFTREAARQNTAKTKRFPRNRRHDQRSSQANPKWSHFKSSRTGTTGQLGDFVRDASCVTYTVTGYLPSTFPPFWFLQFLVPNLTLVMIWSRWATQISARLILRRKLNTTATW